MHLHVLNGRDTRRHHHPRDFGARARPSINQRETLLNHTEDKWYAKRRANQQRRDSGRHDANDLQSTLDALVATALVQTDREPCRLRSCSRHVDPGSRRSYCLHGWPTLRKRRRRGAVFYTERVKGIYARMAMGKLGTGSGRGWNKPSSESFNSIVELEREKGIPRNPFVNAGPSLWPIFSWRRMNPERQSRNSALREISSRRR